MDFLPLVFLWCALASLAILQMLMKTIALCYLRRPGTTQRIP
jgi:hypothetical protein